MKKIVTPHEMQEIDRKTIQNFKITGEVLMECAGSAVFHRIAEIYSEFKTKRILVFCGKGNNGGDGFVVARYLKENGADPKVFVVGTLQDIKMAARIHFNKLAAAGVEPIFISDGSHLDREKPDLVIDALLGTGTRGPLDRELSELVTRINRWRSSQGCYVLAVDIPSGLNGETGVVENTAINANETVTMGLPKSGLLFGDGKQFTGILHVEDIGFPVELTREGKLALVEKDDIKKLLPSRRHDAYKYDFGKVLIIAGSRGMSGAAFLTAKAALRIGAGLVKVALPEGIAHVIENSMPEAMTLRMEETSEGSLAYRNKDRLIQYLEWADVVAIGPGLSQHEETIQLILDIVQRLNKPAVIDADAITALAGKFELIASVKPDIIFTPHVGEFAVLSGVVKEKIISDQVTHVRNLARKLGKIILLKGSPTVIASSHERVFVSNTGNPGMATAGSGDVLTGTLVGLLAQGVSANEAAYAGAYIHGTAGDLAKKEKTEMGLIASDIIEYLPGAIASIIY